MKILLLFIITLFFFAIPVIILAFINYKRGKQPRSCGGSDCEDCWCKK
ncbi:MAG: hypothetical protein VXX25_02805 [Verrucomicrobiota bacterium]|nr:hypothetical protein [Verrucomicrobiota bacterium]